MGFHRVRRLDVSIDMYTNLQLSTVIDLSSFVRPLVFLAIDFFPACGVRFLLNVKSAGLLRIVDTRTSGPPVAKRLHFNAIISGLLEFHLYQRLWGQSSHRLEMEGKPS